MRDEEDEDEVLSDISAKEEEVFSDISEKEDNEPMKEQENWGDSDSK